jgi:hypothetical protein
MRYHLTSSKTVFLVVGSLAAALLVGDAAHAITETAFRYSNPRTGYLGIPPAAFAPSGDPTGAYITYNDGSLLQVSSNNGTCVWAPVNLPQGATMTKLAIWYAKTSGTADLKLVAMPYANGGYSELADLSLADTSFVRVGRARSITGTLARVDNAHNEYWLYFCAQNSSSTYFTGIRLTYTYNNAGD